MRSKHRPGGSEKELSKTYSSALHRSFDLSKVSPRKFAQVGDSPSLKNERHNNEQKGPKHAIYKATPFMSDSLLMNLWILAKMHNTFSLTIFGRSNMFFTIESECGLNISLRNRDHASEINVSLLLLLQCYSIRPDDQISFRSLTPKNTNNPLSWPLEGLVTIFEILWIILEAASVKSVDSVDEKPNSGVYYPG